MEAMILGYPHWAAGQISVTATKQEWQAVMDELLRGGWEPNEESSSLVHWLINQGVYDN